MSLHRKERIYAHGKEGASTLIVYIKKEQRKSTMGFLFKDNKNLPHLQIILMCH